MRVGSELPDSQWTCVAVIEMLRAQAEREMNWFTAAPSAILTTAFCARWFIGSKLAARHHPSCVDVSMCRSAAIVPECAARGMHTFWLRSSKVKVLPLCMLDEAKTPGVRLWLLRGAQICCRPRPRGDKLVPPGPSLHWEVLFGCTCMMGSLCGLTLYAAGFHRGCSSGQMLLGLDPPYILPGSRQFWSRRLGRA